MHILLVLGQLLVVGEFIDAIFSSMILNDGEVSNEKFSCQVDTCHF